jgi:hypothetical protein
MVSAGGGPGRGPGSAVLTRREAVLDNRRVFALAYGLFVAAIAALLRGRRRLAIGLVLAALVVAVAILRMYMTDPLQVNL